MLEAADIIEITLRGASTGVNILVAGLIAASRAPRIRRFLGVLFLWGTANYILVSARGLFDVAPALTDFMTFFAVFNGVFFWWFALSLFDDAFEWTWFKFAPFAAIVILHSPWPIWEAALAGAVEQVLHSSLSVLLMAHAVWIALHDRRDDLVNPRRRFRLYFAVAVGITGMAIAIGENIEAFFSLPDGTTLFHAVTLTALTFFFASWLLSANRALFAPDEKPASSDGQMLRAKAERPVRAVDMPVFEKLITLMDDGVYREEGLTVAVLAEKVGVPEHQLRRLINRELGFRNFSTFLNTRRIDDAKRALADPENARRQILQIALDLGYGSIAPFNRAFKQATGATPTEFRKQKLGDGLIIPEKS